MASRILSILSSLDESIRTSLQSDIDFWFVWLLAFTTLVVVGVVLEGSELFPAHKYRLDLETGMAHFSLGRSRWMPRFARIGWALVALGVAGELLSECFVSTYEARLRTFNNILALSANREVALARQEAESANVIAKGF